MRASRFTLSTPLPETGEVFLFNTLTDSQIVVSPDVVDLIGRVEGYERGRYGGAVGWVDAQGNGTWAVAIRCAELSPDRLSARLVAGGGIVADSDPLTELAETQAKFQAMLGAIVRP